MPSTPAPTAHRAADVDRLTPADRDRWVDALRVGSLLVVVLGHWFMVTLTAGGTITNALSLAPALQPVTWLLQVMPLFFLVGGVAHAHSLESLARRMPSGPGRYAAFVRQRARRLLRPTLVFLAVWLVVGVSAHLAGLTRAPGADGALTRDALVMVPQLLWFVGIYLGVAACAPGMLALHRRHGLAVVAVLVVLSVVVDLLRFSGGSSTGAGLVANLQFALVWLALHQLGFAWRDGLLTPAVGRAMLVGGFGAMLLCVTVGPYPTSMVGLPGEALSNMAPPTVALLAQGVGICGLAVVLRAPMTRLLARPRVWRAVVVAGAFAMTAFLWHLTALLLVLLGLRAAGIDQPAVAGPAWWLTRPVLFVGLAALTAAFVAVFARFDRPRPARDERVRMGAGHPASSRRADPLARLGALVTVLGVLMVSVVGVDVLGARPVFFLVADVTPGAALAVLAAGIALLTFAREHTEQ